MFEKYSASVEEKMLTFASCLDEANLRRYAAVEAAKLGHGGLSYICQLLHIDPKTVRVGTEELEKKT